jgi:hypothetical protein
VRVLERAANDPWLSDGATLVFCSDPHEAARLAVLLRGALPHLHAAALHEEQSVAERDDALAALRGATCRLLVCTGWATRGLDVAELRHVVLYDVPTHTPAYVHAAGRTGRAGRAGIVTCLVESHSQMGQFRQLHALQQACVPRRVPACHPMTRAVWPSMRHAAPAGHNLTSHACRTFWAWGADVAPSSCLSLCTDRASALPPRARRTTAQRRRAASAPVVNRRPDPPNSQDSRQTGYGSVEELLNNR